MRTEIRSIWFSLISSGNFIYTNSIHFSLNFKTVQIKPDYIRNLITYSSRSLRRLSKIPSGKLEMLVEESLLEDKRRANYVIHTRYTYGADIFKTPEKRNQNVLFCLPLFIQKLIRALATSDSKGNVQLI